MSTLRKFLNARKSSTNYTHLSMSPNGKYDIPDTDLPTLYRLISTEQSHILESHTNLTAGPLVIDLDFEYPDKPQFHTRQYTHTEITKFIDSIHSAVDYFFGTVEVEYTVSEKPTPTIETGKRVKDGIHVIGRGLILSYDDQHKLRLYALQKHLLQNSFNMDDVKNKPEAVYDKSVISTNSWYLLGCSKPDREPYLPTLSYTIDDDDLVCRRVEAAFYTPADLSIRCGGEPIACLDERIDEWNELVEVKENKSAKKKLGESKQEVSDALESVSQHVQSVVPFSEMTGGRPAFMESFATLAQLVGLWSRERAVDYVKWRNAVFCISACGKSCGATVEARELAHTFSRGTKYDKAAVDKVFDSEHRGALGFVVAHQWARCDNFTAYMNSGHSVWWKIPWAHFTVAREFFGLFPESFLLVDGYWYYFNGVYWEKDSESSKGDSKTIRKWLSTKFYDVLYEQIKSQREVIEGPEYQKKLGYLNQLLNKSFKNDVLSELGQFYSMSNIAFDARPELFAFTNRIYNLNESTWVEPEADMYISLSCGYPWEDVDDKGILEMEQWVSELFDSREKTEYMLKVLASCMYRHNREERAHFLLGRGRNGKGTIKELMSAALGAYTSKIDLSYFTQPDKHCGGPNQHLYNLKDARVMWCDEAETDGRVVGKFSTGKLKSLTGRDKMKARPMYSGNEAEFEAGHFVALVNEMPGFTSFDFALLTRLVCIRFPYVFMPAGDYRDEDPTHRKQDPRIKERVMERRVVFMAMLLKWYSVYNKEGLDIPDCIREETRKITDELDAVGGWARNSLEFKVNEKPPISVVYRKYVEDMEKESRGYVEIGEFGKRMNRCFELHICRNGSKDDYGKVNRLINYKIKE